VGLKDASFLSGFKMIPYQKFMNQLKSYLSLKNILLYGLSIVWIAIVSYNYFTNPAVLPMYPFIKYVYTSLFLVPFLLTVIFLLILGIKKAFYKKSIIFSFSIIEAVIIFWLMVFFGLLVTGLQRQFISFADILPAAFSLSFKIIVINLWLFLLTAITFVSGRQTLSFLFRKSGNTLLQFIYSSGIGYALISFGLLFLSLLGQLNQLGLGLLLIMLGAIGFKHWTTFIGILRFRISVKSKTTSLVFWSGWILFFTAVVNFSIMIMPFPSGWDSMTYYFNLAKELAEKGMFIRGRAAYPVELVYSSGFIFSKLMGISQLGDMLGIFVSGWGGAMAAVAIIAIGKQLKNLSTGIVAAAVYYSMPMITYFNGWEPKTEVTMAFFMALTISAYFKWRKTKSDGIWLILAAVFFSFSFLIKVTSVLILPALFVVFLFDFIWTEKRQFWQKEVLQLGLAVLACLFVALPWLGVHSWQYNFRITGLNQLLGGVDPKLQQIGTISSRSGVSGRQVPSTGFAEDYGRYLGDKEGWWGVEKYLPKKLASIPVAKYISLPWDITMVSNRKHPNMLISGLFLTLLPVYAAVWLFSKKSYKELDIPKATKSLAIFTIVYLGVWSYFGWGVTWYGLGMLISLSLLLSLTILPSLKYSKFRYLLVTLFFLNYILALILQMNRYGNEAIMHFAFGKTTRDETIDLIFPKYRKMFTTINEDPEIRSGDKYVMWVSTYIPYFIENPRYVLIKDQYLDDFYNLDLANESNNEKTKASLIEAGIKYVIINLNLFYMDETSDRSLENKTLRFMDFASQSLILQEFEEEKGILFLEVI
jgi:4-amino-4-deoxy-L-arabinose transferase-like glycosyltransferase